MVNVKNLFGMAVMATALVGCSSNDNLAPDGKDNVGKAGEAYASFTINLPTTTGTGTRGDEAVKDGTPSFAEGTAAEYEVKNGTILIFDNAGNFVTSAQLGTMNPWTPVKKDGVTTAAITTVQLSGVSVGGDYQALVLLNNDVDATTSKVTLPTTGDTYAEWSKKTSKVNAEKYASTDGIFMANAPMYTGTTTEPTTLVPIANVCASREEAQAKAATTVYVERGLAKVTMQNFTAGGYTVAEGTYKGDKVEIKNWQLDVTNKSTFPVHQIGGTGFAAIWSTPRFYDGGNQSFKRVYWGVDPNYSGATLQNLEACKNAFTMIGKNDIKGETGNDHPQYCLENTFDLDNMKQGQTTRVVFKAKFTPKDFTANETFYKIGNNTAIWNATTLSQQIRTVAFAVMGITTTEEQNKYSVDINAGGENSIAKKAGQHLIKAENITYTGEGKSKVTEDVVNAINEKLGLSEAAGIATYLNGEAYYIARIKHFNELTPWTAGTPYGTDNESYLGRYGVLRNNWYDLSVTSISGLGYPDVPEVKPTLPDDENDQYVNVEVKILSWAKRSQQIKL
ncbi:Mfa1 family fimbria major subunit [Prevotella sp.]|uniref:Mfa1 family fimbria major subunit n=1 Tax=Prevotella sp. TaxID=59823 RepID=UPI0025F45F9E|nr:Mfa1 family fimbria major subunit [Prevotella sp.]MCI6130607.1 Mfa1 family fimbria major subunit [Prevotella sp.]